MNISIFSRTRLREVTLFAAVGVTNTAVDFAVLNILVLLTHHDHGLWLLPIDAVSFLIGLINSYVLNGRFTFRSTELRNFQKFLSFAALNVVGLVINTLVVWALTPPLDRLLAPMVSVNMSKILATVFSLSWNYFAMKRWIFRSEKTSSAHEDSGTGDVLLVEDELRVLTAAMESETKSAV